MEQTSFSCEHAANQVSAYLDGSMTGYEMQAFSAHLERCSACAAEFDQAKLLHTTLAELGPVRPPADLAVRLRVAISHERRRSWSTRRDQLALWWINTVRPLSLKLSAGAAAALLLVGTMMSLLGTVGSSPVLANDEPLGAITAPHYLYSVADIQPISTPSDETLVVEAFVNADGRAYDFRILSGPQDTPVQRAVSGRLLTSVFKPASVFGIPVRGHLLMTYSDISVRG